jgi:hypothetical protein
MIENNPQHLHSTIILNFHVKLCFNNLYIREMKSALSNNRAQLFLYYGTYTAALVLSFRIVDLELLEILLSIRERPEKVCYI